MIRWANKAIKDIATKTLVNRARIVVLFTNNTVTLLEEDMPGTEEVGEPAYAFGLDGAFYIKYGLYIDRIREVSRTAIDESEGGYMYDYLSDEIIYKERQEEFYRRAYSGAVPLFYGVYRYWVTVPRVPHDPPRTRLAPYETLAVWFDNMFTYSDATVVRMFEVQYRRWGPALDLTILHDSDTGVDEYTQPYIYLPDEWDDLLVKKIAKEYLFAVRDPARVEVAVEIFDMETEIKLALDMRGDVDYPWRFQSTDRVPRNVGNRRG